MNDLIKYENIPKVATIQEDDYTNSCLLDYNYFKHYYRMIVIDLSKKQALDTDPKAIQKIHLTANLDQQRKTVIYFITEEAKGNVSDFSQVTVRVS